MMALLGQSWEGSRQGVPYSETLISAPTQLCAPVLLWAYGNTPLYLSVMNMKCSLYT